MVTRAEVEARELQNRFNREAVDFMKFIKDKLEKPQTVAAYNCLEELKSKEELEHLVKSHIDYVSQGGVLVNINDYYLEIKKIKELSK